MILIIGKGYIGVRCAETWQDSVLSYEKVHSVKDALNLIEEYKPDAILNAAGVRGRPNVDWCETHQLETALGNVSLPINLAEACKQTGVYLLHIGSGCVFYGDSPDPKGWTETDFANPISYYSKTKYATDLVLQNLDNVGVARIRVPLDNKPYPGNIIDKLAHYPKIIDVANSLTVIPDMIEVFHQLIEKKGQGIFHVTNPGALKYRDLMKLYREKVDPNQKNEWINEGELVTSGLTTKLRSTNTMQSTRLENLGIKMPHINESVVKAIEDYAKV